MILKDLIFAFRHLSRNKLLAGINVLGLSIGISACLVIFLIASYELSYDRFQPDRDRIFRIYTTFSGVFTGNNSGISTGAAAHVRDNFTGVEAVTNFHAFPENVKVPNKSGIVNDLGNNPRTIIADPEYFQVFSYYEWLFGNPTQSLTEPFKVVITESRAKTYFGDVAISEVIGREIHYRDSLIVIVSGVVKDITDRTDLDFTDFISSSTIEKSWLQNDILLNNWENTNSSSQLFIKLMPGTAREMIEAQIPQISEIYREHTTNPAWKTTPKLQALADLHFDTELGIFSHSRSAPPESALQMLVFVALLLLVIASINFINLETAQASRHSKEVGVRKVLGSSRSRLIGRFLLQSFLLSALSVLVAMAWVELALQYFPEYIPPGLVLDVREPLIALFLVSCVVVVTLFAGLYPAIILSSYQPALALKNLAHANTATSRSSFIRKSLTIFQFSTSQVLIIGTVAIGLQLDYMLNKDLGVTSDAVITVRTPWMRAPEKVEHFKNELADIPGIEEISAHGAVPVTNSISTRILSFDNGKEIVRHNVHLKHGDTAYIYLYGIELLAGRNLIPGDSVEEYLINEQYLHLLGFSNPRDALGTILNEEIAVVGVVKDFHTQSLHSELQPTAISYASHNRTVGMRLATRTDREGGLAPALKKIETAWTKVYPDEEFEYTFMDDSIKRLYETEQRTGKLAGVATVIAILISCLGLFGLSFFTVIQRTKEIGIRKVLGATVNSIMVLLSKDFLKLVLIAFILSTPVAWYVADKWLQGFAYRMDLTAWIFVLSGLSSVLIAFITISFRTVAAAKADPVKALRYE